MTIDLSDPIVLAAGGAVLCLVVAMVALIFALRAASTPKQGDTLADVLAQVSAAQAELAGRIGQMAESQTAAQSNMAERLTQQERFITKAVDEKLAEVRRGVGESLQKTSDRTAETMTQLQQRLAIIDEAQKNISKLGQDMVGLQDILSNKQARGAIGQTQMEDLVRNMLPSSAYAFQAQLSNGKQVDCQIILPNPPGSISVDSKYPLDAYMRIQRAADDQIRSQAERDFKNDVIKHIRDIADKYLIPGETADAAIMFLPAESIFAEIHDKFPDVVTEGFRRRVFLVSPTTMMATLNTVRAILKDAKMREQAGIIQKEIGVLMEDIARLDKRVHDLGRHFEQSAKDIDLIQKSTRKITSRGTKIANVELDDDDQTKTPAEMTQPALRAIDGDRGS